MGTLKDFDPSLLDEEKDCHIFQQEEMPLEAALCRLHHLDGFGFYKTDVCSEKAWDDIEGWQEQSKVDDEDHNPQTIT